ncbi:MAG: hypothetical protein FWH19_05130 [Treponema sp.]|nr:hypothetical protein [Treponema sp.]
MFQSKTEKSADDFWHEYEEKTGEKVLARSLGRYVSGWEEFDSRRWRGIWGLVIATTGGFRFHHFAQSSWLGVLARSGEPKEKTIFIPGESILSVRLIQETKWWKKLLGSSPPKLIVNYRDETGKQQQMLLETDFNSGDLAKELSAQACS